MTSLCHHCRKPLSPRTIARGRKHCSNACRHANSANKSQGLQEPLNDAQEAACNRQITDGMLAVRRAHDVLLWQRTPLDDSPEAERWLRESVCSEDAA